MHNEATTPPGLNILITSSRPHQGKTLAATIIAKALTDHGFSDITVVSEDGDFPKYAMRDKLPHPTEMVQEPRVLIEDTNGRPPTPNHLRFRVGSKTTQE